MANALAHYRSHESTYDQIADELQRVRNTFESADRFTQKVMLFDSTVYAVMSVQNSIDMLKRAFQTYIGADTWSTVREAFKGLNYGNNKFDYCQRNFDTIFSSTGDRIIDELVTGSPWDAVATMVDEIVGVSWIKAPFVGCMLGVTELICIDTNVAQQVPGTKSSGYKSAKEYQEAVQMVRDEFPELNNMLSTFMLQWVVFDANRDDGVARHEEWFNHILPGSSFARQTGLDAF